MSPACSDLAKSGMRRHNTLNYVGVMHRGLVGDIIIHKPWRGVSEIAVPSPSPLLSFCLFPPPPSSEVVSQAAVLYGVKLFPATTI